MEAARRDRAGRNQGDRRGRAANGLSWSEWPLFAGDSPAPLVANVLAALENAPELTGMIGAGPMLMRRPLWEPGDGEWVEREWTPGDTTRLTQVFQLAGLRVGRATVDDAVRGIGAPASAVTPETWGEPFAWRDPGQIPPRRWLLKPHLISGYTSLTVSPGGVGKTTLGLCEAMALATGKPLLGVNPAARTKVWYWNGEDPLEELERRVHAIAMHFSIKREDIEGWLFLGSGRKGELIVAEQTSDGVTVFTPVVNALCQFIRERDIGAVYIDPFVSSHRVSENDNNAVDRVAKAWGRISDVTDCAVDLVHHMRKIGTGEISVDDARGAVALVAAARDVRLLRPMLEAEAAACGIEPSERLAYVRVENGKANMAPRSGQKADWFRLANVHLPNGDEVQAASPWTAPDPRREVTPSELIELQRRIDAGRGEAGEGWRDNVQAGPAWVGFAVAEVLGLDVDHGPDKHQIKGLLKGWLKSGALKRVERQDKKRNPRLFIEVGAWAEE